MSLSARSHQLLPTTHAPKGFYHIFTKYEIEINPLHIFYLTLNSFTEKGLDHIAENILSYLDDSSLRNAELVCKEWRRVIADGMLWKKLIERKVKITFTSSFYTVPNIAANDIHWVFSGPNRFTLARSERAPRLGCLPLQTPSRRAAARSFLLQEIVPSHLKRYRADREQLALWAAHSPEDKLPFGELKGCLLPPVRWPTNRFRT